MATRRRKYPNARYFLRFAGTAILLVAGTLVLVLYVLPQRYVLSAGFREGNLALPAPSTPFEPAPPLRIAALPPDQTPGVVIRGPAELFWARVLPLLEDGRYEEAIPLFAAYLADHPGDPGVRREYGVTFARAGYTDRAVTVLESLLDAEEELPLRLLIAGILRDAGRTGAAAEHYAAALEMRPASEALWLEWARAHIGAEEYPEAEEVLLRALEALPESRAVRVELARVYWFTDRLQEADALLAGLDDGALAAAGALELKRALDAALFVPPPPPDTASTPEPTLLERAMTARDEGDFAGARRLYEQAIDAAPGDVEARQAYADLLQYELMDFEGALQQLRAIEGLGGADGLDMQFRLAQLEIWTDRLADGETRLLALRGRILARLNVAGDEEEAGVLRARLADVEALLGDLRRWQGARIPAVGHYRAALVADPDHRSALDGIALIEADVARDLVEAEQPGLGAVAYSLGDTDDYLRLDLGGRWVGIHDDWVWRTRSGGRLVEGRVAGGPDDTARGLFAELEGGRWWRLGTVRGSARLSVQNVRDGVVDLGVGAAVRHVGRGARTTDLGVEYAPAFAAARTLQSLDADVRQLGLSLGHTRPMGPDWVLALTAEGASLDHRGVPGADRNLRLSGGLSVGRDLAGPFRVGLSGRALGYTDAAPEPGALPLYWDPELSISTGPWLEYGRAIGVWWEVLARVTPGVAWISERELERDLVPDLSGSIGVVREGARYRTSLTATYGQGRFTGYRSWSVDFGVTARGWTGSASR